MRSCNKALPTPMQVGLTCRSCLDVWGTFITANIALEHLRHVLMLLNATAYLLGDLSFGGNDIYCTSSLTLGGGHLAEPRFSITIPMRRQHSTRGSRHHRFGEEIQIISLPRKPKLTEYRIELFQGTPQPYPMLNPIPIAAMPPCFRRLH